VGTLDARGNAAVITPTPYLQMLRQLGQSVHP
jgi:hypothetical protein